MRVLSDRDEHKLNTYDWAVKELELVIGDLMYCVDKEEGEEFKNSIRNAVKDIERITDWMHDFDD
jgi:hypothetical protein